MGAFSNQQHETFKQISSGVIQSSEGYTVNNHGHFEVIYIEGDHIAKFHCEPGSQAYIYSLDPPVAWQPPHENEAIPTAKQELIKDRIVAAVKWRGLGGQFERD